MTSSAFPLEHSVWLEQIIQAWQNLQDQQPLVHYVTNSVAANYVANVLLAAGASPALIDNPFEAAAFTQISSALNINLGTPTTEQMQAMRAAAQQAQQDQTPWVLDPVGYGPVLAWRSAMTDELLNFQPTVIRGNASEISTLAGNTVLSKGVDSTLSSQEAYIQAQSLFEYSEIIAISGESDFILSRSDQVVIQIEGGSYLQPKVTATGCALGALIAAYCAVAPANIATVAAHVHFAIAGELAYQQTQTVGRFNIAFLDAIFSLTVEQIRTHARFHFIAL
jgi:hydroxyethylthiazole kinase